MAQPSRRFHVPSALRGSPFRVNPDEASVLVDRGALLIDVRRQDDPSAAMPGAVRVAPDEIPERLPALREETAILLACT